MIRQSPFSPFRHSPSLSQTLSSYNDARQREQRAAQLEIHERQQRLLREQQQSSSNSSSSLASSDNQETEQVVKCTICLEQPGKETKLVATTCGQYVFWFIFTLIFSSHLATFYLTFSIFCKSCLNSHFKNGASNKKQCPNCRKSLNGRNAIIPLYI
jgi:hypothetical protein